jgi:23S rRNA (guanosine2251-2'-O)-methyltransferase
VGDGSGGGAKATPLEQADLTGPLALVVGAEGAGLTRLVREICDWLVAIPMYGRIESLNAAIAGSIVLAQARQNRPLDRTLLRQTEDL